MHARCCLKCALAQSGCSLTAARASARARAGSPAAAAAAERLESSTALLGAPAIASPYNRSASAHSCDVFDRDPGSVEAASPTESKLGDQAKADWPPGTPWRTSILLGAEGSVASNLQLAYQECNCVWVCFKGGRCTSDRRSVSASHTFSFHEGLDNSLSKLAAADAM